MNEFPEKGPTCNSRCNDLGCFMMLWKYFAIFTVLLCISIFLLAWGADTDLKDLYLALAPFQALCTAVLGILHLITFLRNKHPKITIAAHPQGITITRTGMFRKPSVKLLPLSEITYIAAIGDDLYILTGRQKHKFPQIHDAQVFAFKAVPYLRALGAKIDKTVSERNAETSVLTERWKQRRAARQKGLLPPEQTGAEQPMPSPILPQTTDENGNPIFPQHLTADQAEGVFMPSESANTDENRQQMQQ